MSKGGKKQSFWGTLPGIVTAVGTLLAACAALLTALYTADMIGQGGNGREPSIAAERNANSQRSPEVPTRSMPVVPSQIDRANAKDTARAVLSAYRARDVIALAGLTSEGNREIFAQLAAKGESHPRYDSIFSGWRWQGVQSWSGEAGEARYRHYVGTMRDEYQAHVKFGQLDDDEFLVVTLTWEDDKWCFEDIHSPAPKSFYSGSTSFKLVSEAY